MPTYHSLASQGFYEPWRILGDNLAKFQSRKLQKQQMAQQQSQFDSAHALRKEVDKRAQALFDLQLPVEQLKAKEAQREQRITELGRQTQLAPDLQVPLTAMQPDMAQGVQSMYKRAMPDITPQEIAKVHATQTPGQMAAAPAGMRVSGGTMDPATGQVTQATLQPQIDPTLMGGGAQHPSGAPMFKWVQSPDGAWTKQTLSDPREAQLEAFKHVQNDPAIKNYAAQASQFNLLKSGYDQIVEKGESGMKDVNLIYNFVKSVDPGSVVREGEITIVRSAIPALSKLGMIARKFTKGVQLTPEVRDEIYAAALSAIQGSQQAARQRYDSIYKPMYGQQLPAEAEALTDLPPGVESSAPPVAVTSAQEALQLPEGTRFTTADGRQFIRQGAGFVPTQ